MSATPKFPFIWYLRVHEVLTQGSSLSPNPKSQLPRVRYPNRETTGNNDKQWCVLVFCDQWRNSFRAASTFFFFTEKTLYSIVWQTYLNKTASYKLLQGTYLLKLFINFPSLHYVVDKIHVVITPSHFWVQEFQEFKYPCVSNVWFIIITINSIL